jgi:hypothetical protein
LDPSVLHEVEFGLTTLPVMHSAGFVNGTKDPVRSVFRAASAAKPSGIIATQASPNAFIWPDSSVPDTVSSPSRMRYIGMIEQPHFRAAFAEAVAMPLHPAQEVARKL